MRIKSGLLEGIAWGCAVAGIAVLACKDVLAATVFGAESLDLTDISANLQNAKDGVLLPIYGTVAGVLAGGSKTIRARKIKNHELNTPTPVLLAEIGQKLNEMGHSSTRYDGKIPQLNRLNNISA